MRRPDGLLFNPAPNPAPSVGDILIVLGRTPQLRSLATLASTGPAQRAQV